MKLGLSADELLTTTRAVRKRLDFSRPVEKEVLIECLNIAMQAPTGTNRQGWQWVFVTDPETRQRVGQVYREKFTERNPLAAAYQGSGENPDATAFYGAEDSRAERLDKLIGSVGYLGDHMGDVPVIMIPCIQGRINDDTPKNVAAAQFGSIYPAVWNFMLALRERGLGSAWTSAHLKVGGEEAVAEILGIPFEEFTQVGMFPIAYTIGTDFRPAKRLPAETVMHIDRW